MTKPIGVLCFRGLSMVAAFCAFAWTGDTRPIPEVLAPEEPAHISGVIDRCIEVGVIPDNGRFQHRGARHAQQVGRQHALVFSSMGIIGTQQVAQPAAQSRPGRGAEGHQWIEGGSATGFSGCRRERGQQIRAAVQIEDLVSDRNPNRGPQWPRKHAKRQVLNWERATGAIGRSHPALTLRIMRIIHRYIYKIGLPVKRFLSACHT